MKTIEIKTPKKFFDEEALKLFAETWQGVASDAIIKAMQAYAEQQVSIAVEKALQVAADELDGDGCYDYGANCDIEVKRSNILSLTTQILEELKGGEGE